MDQHLTATFGRIVGNPIPGWWAQTLVYEPPFPDQRLKRGSLYVVIDVAGNCDFDAGGAGKVLLNEIQDAYYRSLEGGVLVCLEGAIKTAWQKLSERLLELQENADIEVNVAAAVRWGTYWYVAAVGTARVALFRQGELETIVISGKNNSQINPAPVIESASGAIASGDYLILATNAFCRLTTPNELKILLDGEPEDTIDALAPRIHGEEGTSRVAAILVHVKTIPVPSVDEEGIAFFSEQTQGKAGKFSFPPSWVKKLVSLRPKFGQSKPSQTLASQTPIYLGQRKTPRRIWPLALVLGCLLLISGVVIVFGPNLQKSNSESELADKEVLNQASQKFEEGKALADLNTSRARVLLLEAKTLLENLPEQDKKNKEVQSLLAQINEQIGSTSRSYEVEPETYYTFSLIREGAEVSDISLDGANLLLANRDGKALYNLDIAKKSARLIIGGDKGVENVDWAVTTAGRYYAVSKSNGIHKVTDSNKEEMVKAESIWEGFVDAQGYGGNIYLLDPLAKQIWKYIPTSSGFSAPRHYFSDNPEVLSDALSMSIDGSVWVLTSSGEVLKFLNGQKENFALKDLDQPLSAPTRIFTSEAAKSIYVLDYGNQRIVVFDKEGVYQAQYRTAKVAQALDLLADEANGRILLVTKEAIFSLPLVPK